MPSQGASSNTNTHPPLKVLIVGCGLGGLACAITCLRQGLEVTILEKSAELGEIGAGIQVPPNAVRVLDHFGLVASLQDAGAILVRRHCLLRYHDGEIIAMRPGDEWVRRHFGQSWFVIHRADCHRMLLQEAERLGAVVRLGAEVVAVDSGETTALLVSGERVSADVIIGADGTNLRSVVRGEVIGYHQEPVETGDLAYRATIPRGQIEAINDSFLEEYYTLRGWLGPNQHAVLYPVRNKACYNLVLLCPDDLPPNVSTAEGNVHEMRALFKGWDPRLTALISKVPNVLKWKICHMKELDTWCKNRTALLGDACHPTLPYQAQGAAMAIEDGAALGVLLGSLSTLTTANRESHVPEILKLYESMRKARTTVNVEGAAENRILYHMEDGPDSEARNEAFARVDWEDAESGFAFGWGNLGYLKRLMGFDTVSDARECFEEWAGGMGFE